MLVQEAVDSLGSKISTSKMKLLVLQILFFVKWLDPCLLVELIYTKHFFVFLKDAILFFAN